MDCVCVADFVGYGVAVMITAALLVILAIGFILWACFGSKRGMDND